MKTMRRSISAVCWGALFTACMGPPRVVSSPKTYLPIKRPSTIWIRQNSELLQVDRPRLLGDSLYGRTPHGEEVWIALDDKNTIIEAREMDKTKTALALGGVIATIALFGTLVGSSGAPTFPENEDSWVGMKRTPFNIMVIRIGR